MNEGIIFATIAMGIIGFNRRDFTTRTIKKFFGLWCIYISLCILAFLCGINNILGLIINLITIFILAYTFVSEFEEQVYYPLIMYYIYMQVNEISIYEMPLRLILTSLGVSIMVCLLYFIQIRRCDYKKYIILVINTILDNGNLNKVITDIIKQVYRRRKGNYYITIGDRKLLNIIFGLEELSKEINTENEAVIKCKLKEIKEYLNNDLNELKKMRNFEEYANIYNFIIKYVVQLESLNMQNKKSYEENWDKADFFSIRNILRRNFKIDSLKMSFAIRMSLSLSLLNLLTKSLEIVKISWIMITVMVLIQPYFEDTIKKGLNRFKGACIGCVLFGILFNLFTSIHIRACIILLAIILYLKVNEYYKKQIFMTFITVGVATFSFDVNMLIPIRIVFISIGIIITYLVCSIILPYKKSRGKYELENKLKENMQLIKREQLNFEANKENLENLRNLILRAIMIGDKLGKEEQVIDECTDIGKNIYKKYL